MKILSTVAVSALLLSCLLFLTGCPEQTADQKAAQQTQQLQDEASRQVGVPYITNFQEMKLMKRIYELRDQEKVMTYTYLTGLDGVPVFLTRSIGYGLPYSTQFTNPQKEARIEYSMPQAEPNGLFMPDSAEATWVVALDSQGKEHVIYVEERVIVSPFLLPNAKGNPSGAQ